MTGSALDAVWPSGRDRRGNTGPELSDGLFRYILATSWHHQIPLVLLTVAVFLLEVVPLELQRRVVNDPVKNRSYGAIVMLCGAYVAGRAGPGRRPSLASTSIAAGSANVPSATSGGRSARLPRRRATARRQRKRRAPRFR